MSTDRTRIEIRGIPVEIVRKDIKHLHLGVYPPEGRVRVAAPLRLDEDAVRMAVIARLAWIRRKQAEFEGQDRQSRREFVTGESHYFEGRRYRLDVLESGGPLGIHLRGNSWIEMRVRPETSRDAREALLYRWYRDRLRERIPEMVATWEPRIGVTVAEWRIRRMKTRWGTCNREAGRIWLNSELAKKPVSCLEYVVVHEMVHLIERGHNERFRGILDRVMPGWGEAGGGAESGVLGRGGVGPSVAFSPDPAAMERRWHLTIPGRTYALPTPAPGRLERVPQIRQTLSANLQWGSPRMSMPVQMSTTHDIKSIIDDIRVHRPVSARHQGLPTPPEKAGASRTESTREALHRLTVPQGSEWTGPLSGQPTPGSARCISDDEPISPLS